jgi:hypothetical protein
MKKVIALASALALIGSLAIAQTNGYGPWIGSGNNPIPGAVLNCEVTSGNAKTATACGTAANPLVVTGGTGGSSGAASAPGAREQDVRASNTLATTLNSAVTLALNGQATVGFTFTGLAASGATVTFEQSNDSGTTWTGVNEVNAGTGVPSATRNTDGQTRVAVQGRTNLRVRVSTAGTGTITVASNISVREGLVTLASPLPPGTNEFGYTSSKPSSAFTIRKTASIGTTAVLVSDIDLINRRVVTNTSGIACELMPAATAYGTGYPLPAGGSFTFDASGRTTAALYVACASTGGTINVISF